MSDSDRVWNHEIGPISDHVTNFFSFVILLRFFAAVMN